MCLRMKGKPTLGVLAALVLLAGAGAYYASLCACVTLRDLGYEVLRGEMHRIVSAQQAFLKEHRRYARTLVELDHAAALSVQLQIVALSDSLITIHGTYLPLPAVTCSLQVGSRTNTMETLSCAR